MLYGILAIALALVAGQNVDWAYGRYQAPAEAARIFWNWAVTSLVVNLVGYAFVPVWQRLCARFPAWRIGKTAWVAFFGVIGLSQLGLMVARALAGRHYLPEIFTARAAAMSVLNGLLINLTIVVLAERHAAIQRDSLAQKAHLQRLSEELLRSKAEMVSEDDRRRSEMARVLHGELQSLLLVSWAELGAAQALQANARSAYEGKLGQVVQRLDQASQVMDSGLAGWYGSVDEAGGLNAALDELVASFRPVMQIRMELAPRLQQAGATMSPTATRAALRMVQEALLNTLKHARAREVRVIGESGPDGGIALRVEDDGRGFGAERASSGLGFAVLGQELEAHGGSWTVSSSPGRGTCLQVCLPRASA